MTILTMFLQNNRVLLTVENHQKKKYSIFESKNKKLILLPIRIVQYSLHFGLRTSVGLSGAPATMNELFFLKRASANSTMRRSGAKSVFVINQDRLMIL